MNIDIYNIISMRFCERASAVPHRLSLADQMRIVKRNYSAIIVQRCKTACYARVRFINGNARAGSLEAVTVEWMEIGINKRVALSGET